MKRFAIANRSRVTFIPSYNDEGKRFIECYFYNCSSRIEAMRDHMSELFPGVVICINGDNMYLKGNRPCDDKLFNALQLSEEKTVTNDDFNNEIQVNNPSQKHKNKTSRNISKQLEQQAEKSIITPEKTAQPILTKFQSGIYDPDYNKCRTTILSGNGLPYGRFFLTSKLNKNDFPDNDDAFKKVSQKIANSKKANARQNAEGIIFIDPIEVKCDNKDSSFVAEAKIKLKGNHGDMRVFLRKESNKEGKVLYIAEGVMKKAHK